MTWDIGMSDPNYPLYFQIVIGLQYLFLLFAFIYLINLIVDVLVTKKKLNNMNQGFINITENEIFEEKLLIQKEKYKLNKWLTPILDFLICLLKNENSNNSKLQMEKLLVLLKEKILKNNFGFMIMPFFSFFSSAFVAAYELQTSIGSEINKFLGSLANSIQPILFVTSFIIAMTISIFYLKNYFYRILKKNIVDLSIYMSSPEDNKIDI